ncbi:hypothetical protein [Couchioplanes caeruleus]|uniref:AceR3 n=2 Tax=Couchioplanes caeruleus TaxID=56438 RepID=A0A1K0FTR9_9ACTN|nr:hypothetical protein [Couchioplanes caeruleus]OJF16263.1 AceR3 [Couchioplanes caeruleus subsp. caeruleus]ROP28385.1 hypothetical protein EDD30_1140 [Couchioplanes caeruleus]
MTDPNPDLVERRTYLRRIGAALSEARAGRPSVTVLCGRRGNGQPALVRLLARDAADQGMLVLQARAGRDEQPHPYAAVRRFTARFAGGATGGRSAAAEAEAMPVVLSAVQALHGRPALVVIHDAHAWDDHSQRWFRAFLRHLPGLPMAVLLAGSRSLDRPDRAALHPDRVPVTEIRLPPLTPSGVARVVEACCGAKPDSAFAAAAARLSAGSPEVLGDSLRLFRAGPHRPVAAHVAELEAAAGSAWVDFTLRVLRDVPAEVIAVLRAVAVCDGLLDLPLVYTLAPPLTSSAPRMRAMLDACGLTVGDGDRVRPISPHVAERLLDELSVEERADLHARAAELAHRSGAADEEVADLLLSARPVGARWAVHRLRRSSAILCRAGRYERGVAHLARVLDEPLSPVLRGRIGIELAGMEAATGPEASDRRLAEIARTDGHHPSRAVVAAVDLCLARGDADRTRRAVLRALGRVGPDERERLLALGALADELRSHPADLVAPAMPALADRPRCPAQAGVRAWSLAVRAGDRATAVALARHALSGDSVEVMPQLAACRALILADELDEAGLALDRLAGQLRGGHATAPLARVLGMRAELQMRRGRLDLAARDLQDGERVLPSASWHPLILPLLLTVRIALSLEADDRATVQKLAGAAVPAGVEEGPYWPFLLFARALAAWGDCRPADAADLLHHCGRALARQGWMNPALLPWRSLAAEVWLHLGDLGRARQVAAEESALARRWGAPAALGWAARTRLRVAASGSGKPEDAAGVYEAVRLLRRSPARLTLGWTTAELADTHLARGEHDAARHWLSTAESVAAAYPCGRLARRLGPIRETLRPEPAAVVPGPPSIASAPGALMLHPGWAALSEKDRLTAVLAGRGNLNRHIAVLLSISQRAVELRLSRVYRAMRLSGRDDLRSLVRAAESG